MKYIVIVEFTDLQDNSRKYRVGDEFPRLGFAVSAERLEELSTNKNRRKFPVIEAVETDEPVKADASAAQDVAQNVVNDEPKVESDDNKNASDDIQVDPAVPGDQEPADEPKPVKTSKGKKKNDNK